MTNKFEQTELMLFIKSELLESIDNLKSEIENNENYNNYKILEVIYNALESIDLGIGFIFDEKSANKTENISDIFL